MGFLVEGMRLTISRETLEGHLGFKIDDKRELTVETLRCWLGASSIEVVCDLRVADISMVISELFSRLVMVTISCMAPSQEAATVSMEVGGKWVESKANFSPGTRKNRPSKMTAPFTSSLAFLSTVVATPLLLRRQ